MKSSVKTLLTAAILNSALGCQIISDQTELVEDTPHVLHARFVPERKDDFAWENDLVAFRAYGPALRNGSENSGTDCWLKRVKYPIINKWYDLAINQGISYHEDNGEGLDNYKVGASMGCGGTSIFRKGKMYPLETFVAWSDLKVRPEKLGFTLHYKNEIEGEVFEEDKSISLIPGTRLFKVKSVFRQNGELAPNLRITLGITTHKQAAKLQFAENNEWVSGWESLDGSGLGTAVLVADGYKSNRDVLPLEGADQDDMQGMLTTRTNSEGEIVYYAGYGWEKAGEITTQKEWLDYLNSFEQY